MEDTYKIGDAYSIKYDNAPRSAEDQHKAGQQLIIRGEGGTLLAIWEVEKSDEKGAEGKIIRVFRGKIPMDPRRTKPL
jgi:hypothetical protein